MTLKIENLNHGFLSCYIPSSVKPAFGSTEMGQVTKIVRRKDEGGRRHRGHCAKRVRG